MSLCQQSLIKRSRPVDPPVLCLVARQLPFHLPVNCRPTPSVKARCRKKPMEPLTSTSVEMGNLSGSNEGLGSGSPSTDSNASPVIVAALPVDAEDDVFSTPGAQKRLKRLQEKRDDQFAKLREEMELLKLQQIRELEARFEENVARVKESLDAEYALEKQKLERALKKKKKVKRKERQETLVRRYEERASLLDLSFGNPFFRDESWEAVYRQYVD
eukprot:RCo032246